jgi:hypothetical protein
MHCQSFDGLIFKNAIKRTSKSTFTWIWFTIIVTLMIPTGYLTTLHTAWTWGLILLFIVAIVGIAVFDIVNLNMLYSVDYEMGLMNLEMRKGRTKTAIFLSRLVVNKIYTFGFAGVTFLVLLLFAAIADDKQMGNWPLMIFLIIPFDFILTGIFLFFFSLFKHKLAIGMTSIAIMAIALSPFAAVVVVTTNESLFERTSVDEIQKSYLADAGFKIIMENQSSAFAKMVSSSQLWPSMSDVMRRGVNGSTDFLEAGILNNDDINKVVDSTVTFNDAMKDTFLYKINNDWIDNFATSINYQNSIYSNGYTTGKKDYTLAQLKNTIGTVNKLAGGDKNIKEFNQLIYRYATYNISPESIRSNIEEYLYTNSLWGDKKPNLNIGYTYVGELINTTDKNTSVGLLTWNKIAAALIANLRTYRLPKAADTKAVNRIFSYLIPALETAQTVLIPNGAIHPLHYLRDADNGTTTINWLLYNDGSRWADTSAETNAEFTGDVNIASYTNPRPYSKLYSVAGYEIVLLLIGLGIVGCAYYIFFKKIKL